MKKWSHVLSAAILTVGICLGYGQEAQAMVGGKPVIGISWKSPKQAKSYEAFKKIITMAGGIPVELDQIKSTDVTYAADGTVDKAYVEPSGMLKQAYADKIRQDGFDCDAGNRWCIWNGWGRHQPLPVQSTRDRKKSR